jgi:hypothetical protein
MLLGLLGPYHQHAISTFNTCSWGPTHQSLTDKSRGYNPGGAGFPQTTPQPSGPTVSTFHLRAPPGLYFNHKPSIKPKFKEPMAATWSSDHSAIYRDVHLRLAITTDLSLALESIRVDWKVSLMQLRHRFNSYKI